MKKWLKFCKYLAHLGLTMLIVGTFFVLVETIARFGLLGHYSALVSTWAWAVALTGLAFAGIGIGLAAPVILKSDR